LGLIALILALTALRSASLQGSLQGVGPTQNSEFVGIDSIFKSPQPVKPTILRTKTEV